MKTTAIMSTPWIAALDQKISALMDRYCLVLMKYSLALIFIWFGLLKPLGMSPEEELIKRTVYFFPPDIVLNVLGCWEVAIGIGLLYRPLLRLALFLLLIELPGTFLPLVVLPDICFHSIPFGLSLEGQYIIKNLFMIGAAFVIGSKVSEHSFVLRQTESPAGTDRAGARRPG